MPPKKTYRKPRITKTRNSSLVLKMFRARGGEKSCRQCSGCHGCR